jgi:bifunctional NMN adenylyltransferase/nudix hydrolase
MYKLSKRPYAAIIGRFQPFHNGHKALFKECLKKYQKLVVVLGSAQSAPTIKNPFTPEDREAMIRPCLTPEENAKLSFVSVRDYPYNINIWLTEVRTKVLRSLEGVDTEVDLVGHYKDRSSFYLKLFPNWQFNEMPEQHGGISSTQVREAFFRGDKAFFEKNQLPKPVSAFLDGFAEKSVDLKQEFEYLEKYKASTQFVGANFAPTFVTVDAVVVQSGHVLVVRRKHNPGKGKLALPGGFIHEYETLQDACIRELKEETKIQVGKPILESNIRSRHTFDDPYRSLRGRTITNAFFIPLPENLKHGLPLVEGNDDAKEAFWLPLADVSLKEDEFFEDHAHIVRYFTKTM